MSESQARSGAGAAAGGAAPAAKKPVQVKLVLLGEAAVGKSSVVTRFVANDFQENKEPTVGAAFLTQKCMLDDRVIKFEIWDTAGQERFHSLAPMYYRNAQASIIVYDITDAKTLEKAKSWVKELQRQANPNIVIALIGNKLDLVQSPAAEPTTPTSATPSDDEADDATATPTAADNPPIADKRQVSKEDAKAYAEEQGLLWGETSAKTGEGVVEIFTDIAKKLPVDDILASSRGGASGTGGRAGAASAAAAAASGAGGNIRLGGRGEGEAAKEGCAC